MTRTLAGKRCLIVGGSSGLGLAATRLFVAEGAHVVAAGLPTDPTDVVPFLPCDARDAAQIDDLFTKTLALLGGLDVLYHVAGGSGRRHGDGPLHACSDDGWHFTLDVNLTSTFLTNRAAVRHFLATKQPGCILNMASVLALAPAPRHFDTIAYAAAKGGVISLSRLAAARYATDGIRVNVLAPGLVDTPMARRAVGDATIRAYLRLKQPLADGPAAADDCAGAAVFLCSDAARLVTGVVLPVDGGWSVADADFQDPRH